MNTHQYQPGNGCNYDLVYTKYRTRSRFLLCWLRKGGSGGTCISFDGGNFLAIGYLMEKMDVGEDDARALLQFLAEQGHDTDADRYPLHPEEDDNEAEMASEGFARGGMAGYNEATGRGVVEDGPPCRNHCPGCRYCEGD